MISQRLSLNMPRLNQNQRIQALTMLARGDNVSNVSRAFGCHRNTIIRLRQRFQQTGGVADRRRPGRPRVTRPRTDRFVTLTHLRRRFQTATSSARQYDISKQCCAASGKPGNPFSRGGRHRAACLQWAQRHFRWGDSSGFGCGSVMVWGSIMGRRKTNLIVVLGNLNAQGYIKQILQPEAVPFLQRHGPAI